MKKLIWVAAVLLSFLAAKQLGERFQVSGFLAWYDAWVGMFYDQKKKTLYVCPLPCVVLKVEQRPKSWPPDHELAAMIARRRFL